MAKHIFNSEVNFVSDWVMEHKPKKLGNKRYKLCAQRTLEVVFQEDPHFNLAGDILQVKDDISQIESGVKMEPLDGAKFVYLSDYMS
jgi:hypothetical protein